MPRLPRLPRRRPRWQQNLLVAAGATAEFVAWFAIGFVALVVADTAPVSGTWGALLWLVIFCTVIGAGASVMNHRQKIIRAFRNHTPERHRRDPSSNSQAHNLSKRGLSRVLNRRFRRG